MSEANIHEKWVLHPFSPFHPHRKDLASDEYARQNDDGQEYPEDERDSLRQKIYESRKHLAPDLP